MKLLSATQIQQWDAYTIENEPISSFELMERAGTQCAGWILENAAHFSSVKIFCGKGNNGGDGLVIARLLLKAGLTPEVYILEFGAKGTDDFQQNLQLLHTLTTDIRFIQSNSSFPELDKNDLVIDALFGSGINRPLQGLNREIVDHINKATVQVISIDVPSGMYIDKYTGDNSMIRATTTLTFQVLKLCFLLPENASFFGKVQVLDIGLKEEFLPTVESDYILSSPAFIKEIYKKRSAFGHKGTFGHALLITGNTGKMGAAVLASKACMRAGAGLLTVNVPADSAMILQVSIPEAMTDQREKIIPDTSIYSAIGIGPGIGTTKDMEAYTGSILSAAHCPVVLDADALNCLSTKKEGLAKLPANSILTPHPKEFDRLFGSHNNQMERIEKALSVSRQHEYVIVLKGHYTFIASKGKGYFNTTGNAGMATAGSGDVLTGIITSLLAQKYELLDAALLGVHIHGLAGDKALSTQSMESLIASDIIEHLGEAFITLQEE